MIEIRDMRVRLGKFTLRDVNLRIREGEYFVILGPTGSGKTVILEAIAGLCRIRKGAIFINGEDATNMPPERRRIAYVPQDYALFPFLNVRENIRFGLKKGDVNREETDRRIGHLAHLLGITHLLERPVGNLSGGEKQRVSLARALATAPRILLLDEPLSSLDVSTAKYLRLELRRFHDELGITTIHVTHNLMEAEELADRIAIIDKGNLEQVGTREEIFLSPCNETVSNFIGTPNILSCEKCSDLGHGLIEAVCGRMPVILPYEGAEVRKIALFPRDIYVSAVKPPGPQLNRFRGIVRDIQPFSSLARLKVQVGDNVLLTEMPKAAMEEMAIEVGQEVYLILKIRGIRIV
ncbi:MAG TPA: ABC transporter ATP-binding protein [Syntrophales bacterium]|nr:ABC transporter ATP-binding protein [Syntrophales bacterium]